MAANLWDRMRACHHFDDLAAGRSRKAMYRVSFVRLWHLLLPQRPSTPESTAHWVLAWQKTSSPQRSFPYHRRLFSVLRCYSCLPLRAQCPFRCHTPEPPKVKPKKYPKGHLYAEFDLCPNKCVPRGPETTVQKKCANPAHCGKGGFCGCDVHEEHAFGQEASSMVCFMCNAVLGFRQMGTCSGRSNSQIFSATSST